MKAPSGTVKATFEHPSSAYFPRATKHSGGVVCKRMPASLAPRPERRVHSRGTSARESDGIDAWDFRVGIANDRERRAGPIHLESRRWCHPATLRGHPQDGQIQDGAGSRDKCRLRTPVVSPPRRAPGCDTNARPSSAHMRRRSAPRQLRDRARVHRRATPARAPRRREARSEAAFRGNVRWPFLRIHNPQELAGPGPRQWLTVAHAYFTIKDGLLLAQSVLQLCACRYGISIVDSSLSVSRPGRSAAAAASRALESAIRVAREPVATSRAEARLRTVAHLRAAVRSANVRRARCPSRKDARRVPGAILPALQRFIRPTRRLLARRTPIARGTFACTALARSMRVWSTVIAPPALPADAPPTTTGVTGAT